MAAPIANKITLPSDTGNSGKNVRTQTRVVGGDTVHEHFFVPIQAQEATGKYFFSSTQQTVSDVAHNATATGFFWLQLPSTATVTAIIRFIRANATASAASVFASAPVVSFSKFTFTGTASGALVTPVKFQTAGAANQLIIRTLVTGMVVTVVGAVGQFQIPSIMTAVGAVHAGEEVIPRNALSYTRGQDLEIAPGEGLVVYQTVAGTAADTRKFNIQIEFDEVDLS